MSMFSMFDPTQLLSQIIGTKQLGAPAPAPTFGGSPGVAGLSNPSPTMQVAPQPNILGSILSQVPQGQAQQAQPTGDQIAPIPSKDFAPTPTPSLQKPGFGDTFFGSINDTIQDPAKLLIMGLLNGVGNTRYGTLGLLGKGLFDAFRSR